VHSNEFKDIGLNHFVEIMKHRGKSKADFNIDENIVYNDKLLSVIQNLPFSNSRKIEVFIKCIALRMERIKTNHCE